MFNVALNFNTNLRPCHFNCPFHKPPSNATTLQGVWHLQKVYFDFPDCCPINYPQLCIESYWKLFMSCVGSNQYSVWESIAEKRKKTENRKNWKRKKMEKRKKQKNGKRKKRKNVFCMAVWSLVKGGHLRGEVRNGSGWDTWSQ